VVVTSINEPTQAVRELAANPNWTLLVVGDNKTPADWSVPSARFLPIGEQRASRWTLAGLLPENHYCRKNLGYLEAISHGAVVVAETDDDNLPGTWPPVRPQRRVVGTRIDHQGWVNVYPYFTEERVWPRGYPLQHVVSSFVRHPGVEGEWEAAVHQYLASGDPDVDAIYRLTVGKVDHTYSPRALVLGAGATTTFNSQCTLWFPEAFPLLYLPSFVSFRMTDIWRSLVAQVCLWAQGDMLSYHGDGVTQLRNEHSLIRDFEDEVVGYLRNDEIARELLSLRLSGDREDVSANLVACYRKLHEINVVTAAELDLVHAWVADLDSATAA